MNSKEHRGTTLGRGILVLISYSQSCPVPRAAKLKHQPPDLRVTPRVGQQDSFKGITAHRVVQLTVGCQEKVLGEEIQRRNQRQGKESLRHHAKEKHGSREQKEEKKGQSYIRNTCLAMLCTSPPTHPVFLLSSASKNFS